MKKKVLFHILELLLLIGLSGLAVYTLRMHEIEFKRCEWWFRRNGNGVPPQAEWGAGFLRRYDAYYLGDIKEKVIYLTFDEGYKNENAHKILDILKENNVPAAFFVTASFLKKAPEITVRMVEEGHVVGNHTAHHADITEISKEELAQELAECEQLFQEVTGREMDPFFRPPEGVYNIHALKEIKELGYKTVFWSMAYRDWDVDNQPTEQEAYSHMLTYCHSGCIPLLHVVSSTNTKVLDSVIKELKAEGYEFKSLYDLP